jgi:transposase
MSVRELKRIQVLLMLDNGRSAQDAGKAVGLTERGAHKIAARYRKGGFKRAVEEPSRPGRARAIKPREEARLVAMLCGPSPEGRARWTVRLASEEAEEQGICKAGRETIRVFMTERSIKPWREKNVVHRGENA